MALNLLLNLNFKEKPRTCPRRFREGFSCPENKIFSGSQKSTAFLSPKMQVHFQAFNFVEIEDERGFFLIRNLKNETNSYRKIC